MMGNFYCSTYCNFPHSLDDGTPIDHECVTIPVEALEAEMDGDFELAVEIMSGNHEWQADEATSGEEGGAMKILGFTEKYLDGVECSLTHEGAKRLEACRPAMDMWGRKYKKQPMTAAQVVDRFEKYCPAHFCVLAMRELGGVTGAEHPVQVAFDESVWGAGRLGEQLLRPYPARRQDQCRPAQLCTCHLSVLASEDRLTVIRMLKAVIIAACQEKGGSR